ncbi:MAG: hypothetical protein CMK32_11855 [Porticoccaceae bacterium]|nr:hypothetical protein [Porticoccaceae bacterium]
MGDDKDDDIEEIDEVDETDSDQEEVAKSSPIADLEARRRLEQRLEERRLQKLIQDYDFDDVGDIA